MNEICPICLEKFKKYDIAITKCRHAFCLDCIIKCICESNTCPLCRTLIFYDDERLIRSLKTNTIYLDYNNLNNYQLRSHIRNQINNRDTNIFYELEDYIKKKIEENVFMIFILFLLSIFIYYV